MQTKKMVNFSKILRQHPLAMHSTGVKIRSCKLIFKGLPPSLNIPTYLQVLIELPRTEVIYDWNIENMFQLAQIHKYSF